MIVLSLFDGLGGARIALDQLGIECEYLSSEIDKYAIKIHEKNYPDSIHLGDVKTLKLDIQPDLLIGGSPCQNLTMGGNKTGLKGDKSILFYEYLKIKNELNPKYFLLENVSSMKNSDRDKISELMGVNFIKINSADFTAQNRNRYYWTNIPIATWDKQNTFLKDIIEDNKDFSDFHLSKVHHEAFVRMNQRNPSTWKWRPTDISGKSIVIMASYSKIPLYGTYVECKESESGYRMLTPVECEKLQGLPDGYTEGVSKFQRYKMIGNGFTIPVIKHILKHLQT